jgi:hypothetical protein
MSRRLYVPTLLPLAFALYFGFGGFGFGFFTTSPA